MEKLRKNIILLKNVKYEKISEFVLMFINDDVGGN